MTDCEDEVWLGSEAISEVHADSDLYDSKVMSYSPLIYYPCNYTVCCNAEDRTLNEYDGTIVGPPWLYGQDGIGDGKTSINPQGANCEIEVPADAETFINANGAMDELSWMGWFYVDNADQYLPATSEDLFFMDGGGGNILLLQKLGAGTDFHLSRRDPNNRAITVDNGGALGWMQWGITVSVAADRMRIYFNGSQVGSIGTIAAVPLVSMLMTGRNVSWFDNLAKLAYWNSELTPAVMADLAIVI